MGVVNTVLGRSGAECARIIVQLFVAMINSRSIEALNWALTRITYWGGNVEELTHAKYMAVIKPRSSLTSLVLVCVLAVGVAIPAYNKGVVLVAEVILIPFIFLLIPVIAKDRFLKATWAVSLLWCVAQLVSDWVHGTEMFSAPTFVGPMAALLATGLYWLYSHFRLSLAAIMAAVGIGWIGLTLLAGSAMASSNPWKYGLSTPIVVTVLALAYLLKFKRGGIIVMLVVLAVVSLRFDSRFVTGLLICSAFGLIVGGRPGGITKRGIGRLAFLAALGLAVYLAYPSIALSGMIGERAYLQQVLYESEGANFLLATRLEFPQMIYLVSHNPLLGIGSYGRLDSGEAFGALGFLNEYVAPLSPNAQNYMLNPSEGYPGYNAHSSAMGSALFAGVLALPFWIFLMASIVRSILRFSQGRAMMPALLIYISGLSLWDIFFSPLTTRSHVSLAVTIFMVGATLAWSGAQPAGSPVPSTERR